MSKRTDLQKIFEDLLGTRNVYFQPPSNIRMTYPAIVYQRSHIAIRRADNKSYTTQKRYQVTVIDPDPDSVIPDIVSQLPMCSFDRHYVSDNLNHDVFTLYF